ncbi:MAG: hypothetical protein ABEK16_03800 [Candidatus Nanohalobium sp.]
MKFDEVMIEDPREIFASVRRTAEESEVDGPYRIGLKHDHTSAIRGYAERETGLGEEVDGDAAYPMELTREDGGDTWYHSPESRCLMLGVPDNAARNHVEYMRAWGNLLADELEDFAEENDLDISPEYRGSEEDDSYFAGDIYDEKTGKQLIGLSGRSFENSTVVRACMYDGEQHGELFDEIVEADTGEDAENFRQKYMPVEGFYDSIVDKEETEEVEIEQHLEPDVSPDKGRHPSPCIDRAT